MPLFRALVALLSLASCLAMVCLLSGCAEETVPANVSGEAFVKLDRGTDMLAGMPVYLVDAKRCRADLADTLARFSTDETNYASKVADRKERARKVATASTQAASVQQADQTHLSTEASIDQANKAIADKTDELARFRKEHWSTFVYSDPISGQQIPITCIMEHGTAMDPERFQSAVALMSDRIAQLKTRVDALSSQTVGNHKTLDDCLDRLHGCVAPNSNETTGQLLGAIRNGGPSSVASGETESAIDEECAKHKADAKVRLAKSIEACIINCAVEKTVTDSKGYFAFQNETPDEAFVFARHESKLERLCWLIAVRDPIPPKLQLSNVNSRASVLDLPAELGSDKEPGGTQTLGQSAKVR